MKHLLLVLFCAFPIHAGDWDFTLNSDTFSAWEQEPLAAQGEGLASWRLRFNLTYDFSPALRWEGAYEAAQSYRRRQVPFALPIWLRADDARRVAHQGDDQVWLHNLDRFRLTWEKERWRVTLGRQSIGHGSGVFFNPSDIFAPLSPFTLNTQYKSGVDGIRVTRSVGDLGEAELIALFPQHGEGIYVARYALALGGVDVSVMGGQTYGEFSLIWDVATSFAGAAVYSEGLWRKGDGRDDSLRVMAGFSRRFGTKTDFILETHYQSQELNSPIELLLSEEFQHGELFLINPRHLALSLRYEAHPLVSVTASALAETEDGSTRLQLGLSWDASERSTVSAGYLNNQGGQFSEFGAGPDSVYAELRVTFP